MFTFDPFVSIYLILLSIQSRLCFLIDLLHCFLIFRILLYVPVSQCIFISFFLDFPFYHFVAVFIKPLFCSSPLTRTQFFSAHNCIDLRMLRHSVSMLSCFSRSAIIVCIRSTYSVLVFFFIQFIDISFKFLCRGLLSSLFL